MKKTFILLLTLSLLLSLSACSGSPIEKAQQRAVSIGEQFLDFKITTEEAVKQLSSIKVPETESDGAFALTYDIEDLIELIADPDATHEEIREKVKEIKDCTLYTYVSKF